MNDPEPPADNKSGLVKFIKVNSCLPLSIQERIYSLFYRENEPVLA